jgi:hypothetical protein
VSQQDIYIYKWIISLRVEQGTKRGRDDVSGPVTKILVASENETSGDNISEVTTELMDEERDSKRIREV